jgi:hypothetical protein
MLNGRCTIHRSPLDIASLGNPMRETITHSDARRMTIEAIVAGNMP